MKRVMVAAVLACVAGCGVGGDPWAGQKGVKVIATIPALASLVHEVGGEHVAVRLLCEKTGPHHYEADARELAAFRTADLFLTVGLSLDDKFARDLFGQAKRKELLYVKVGNMLPETLLLEMKHDHDHGHGHEGHHHHGAHDPHVWLGIPQAVAMVNIIRDELARFDPDHAADYDKNAAAYIAKLKKLQADGQAMLKDKKVKGFIAFHDSFAYFAKSFGLNVVAAMETEPGDAPTPAYLAKIVKLCQDQKHPVGCITVEPQFAAGSAKTVRDELKGKGIDIKLAEVDPLETGDAKEVAKEKGAWYESRMRKNLKAMASALP